MSQIKWKHLRLSLAIQALSTRSLNEFLAQQAVRACAVRACDQFALATAGEAQIRALINNHHFKLCLKRKPREPSNHLQNQCVE